MWGAIKYYEIDLIFMLIELPLILNTNKGYFLTEYSYNVFFRKQAKREPVTVNLSLILVHFRTIFIYHPLPWNCHHPEMMGGR